MRRLFKILGVLTALGSVGAGIYYFLFLRSRKPQVELYFDDGSMLALPADAPEAAPLVAAAAQILRACPITRD